MAELEYKVELNRTVADLRSMRRDIPKNMPFQDILHTGMIYLKLLEGISDAELERIRSAFRAEANARYPNYIFKTERVNNKLYLWRHQDDEQIVTD